MNAKELADAARAKWRSSGLTDEQARKLKFSPVADASKLDEVMHPLGAMKIPYWTLAGKPTDFFRVRYLEQPSDGFAKDKEKKPRYAQPSKTLNAVYFPPLLDWPAAAKNPETAVYITEGELKAAAGCSAGLYVMGLGGVDVWRSTKRECAWLPALEDFVWKDRLVGIVYDSDAAENPNVMRATHQLAHALLERGARPCIANIPKGPDGEKVGLDDFLVRNGPEAVKDLLNQAPALPESEALWSMNEEVVYIRDPGLVIVRETGQKISPSAFVQHAYANRHYISIENGKNGPVQIEKPLAKRWLEWPSRFELRRVTYMPGEGPFVQAQWNSWKGWGCVPKAGPIGPWKWLMSYLFRDDTDAARWFQQWLAYPLQHPGTKLFTSAAIWGIYHGTGKTLVGHTMLRIYGENATEISDQDLHANFNEWAENKQFVMGDDITGSDKRAEMDNLKRRITQQQMRINAKFIPTYVVPDCVNYFFTSNAPDAFFLEDNDRRFFIHEVVGPPAEHARYLEYDEWYKRKGGDAALFDYLLKLPLTGFDPRAPARMTNSKRSMIEDNKSDLGSWCYELARSPEGLLRTLGERAAKEADLLSAEQLLKAYDPAKATKVTSNGLGRELKRAGLRHVNGGIGVRTDFGLQKLYAVRNAERWARATPKALGEHWNGVFGKGARKF